MPLTAHFNGVQINLAMSKAYNLGTECGIDVQAQYLAVFFGSMLDWDVRWPAVVTPYTTFFPMWGVIMRDKVLLYQHVLSRYADELVANFEPLGDGISKTTFKTFVSYSSWNNQTYAINGHTISANGAATIANSGTAVAGVFTVLTSPSMHSRNPSLKFEPLRKP